MLKKVYIVSKRIGKDTCWAKSLKVLLAKYDLAHLWENEKLVFNIDGHGNRESKNISDHQRFFEKFVRGKIQEQQEKQWWLSMTSGDVNKKKIRTYITFKTIFSFGEILINRFKCVRIIPA